jgi:hypothetical protein
MANKTKTKSKSKEENDTENSLHKSLLGEHIRTIANTLKG